MKFAHYQQGYTLVEMLVATSIFVGVITMAAALLLSSIASQQRVIAEQELYDDVSYVAEYMSRAIRMAQKSEDATCLSAAGYQAEVAEGTPEGKITFVNSEGVCQFFSLVVDGEGVGTIKESLGGGPLLELTSGNIDVEAFRTSSFLKSEAPADQEVPLGKRQARLTFAIEAKTRKGNPATQPSIIVQTTISPRQIEPGN